MVTARSILRQETRDNHDRVDALFSDLRLSDRADYGRFLVAQANAFLPCEAALDEAGAGEVLPDWAARKRSDALRSDLAALGLDAPEREGGPHFTSPAAVLGGIYVLEGSRLGGAMLARSVPADFPKHFLTSGSAGAWRTLIQLLDDRLRTEEEIRDAVAAARNVFGVFERSGHAKIKAD